MASNRKMVPECRKALDQMKYEIAAELGLPVGGGLSQFENVEFATELGGISSGSIKEDYWGHIASRDAGAVGGSITRRLVQQAEQTLFGMQ
ncbi:alpha/beta-type small acid-soluble spore protein [Paenibacillus ginsengarvi]|uniref:Alpha/beta-type small acid-soluble spore protein n=1 Tax=Paenibacillus ginsengarvi TaxID=400777 RepID=A0A3B0C6U4_9BACL|nr:alpha/beta-type small acid-soluble spore protein [Paenibacillus ginsengarvi]RKN78866.1 alpha/beta-type small acid-soluble spore protein [Paenibacillus ginsengarvi]